MYGYRMAHKMKKKKHFMLSVFVIKYIEAVMTTKMESKKMFSCHEALAQAAVVQLSGRLIVLV